MQILTYLNLSTAPASIPKCVVAAEPNNPTDQSRQGDTLSLHQNEESYEADFPITRPRISNSSNRYGMQHGRAIADIAEDQAKLPRSDPRPVRGQMMFPRCLPFHTCTSELLPSLALLPDEGGPMPARAADS